MDSSLPIPDEAIRQLLQGNEADVDAAVTILWNHLAAQLAAYALRILPQPQAGDCKDVVSAAFVKLLKNPRSVTGSPLSFLTVCVRNGALDRCRRQEVLERILEKSEDDSALTPTSILPPDEALVQKERTAAASDKALSVLAVLGNITETMGLKQKEVARFMLKIVQESARWPTTERIREELVENEPGLREDTVKDRRKEVLAKFNPVLQQYGRNPVNE